ncbi:DMT family transporter [Larkinella insperata]|uniref:DMT family transporter n=1 Tax=Larkinella insperata TaxID=332158 RepID=A0ABW3QIV3_9BACT|nr:EamA family transporter [Larkinella insperata]
MKLGNEKSRWVGFALAIVAATFWGVSGAFAQFLFNQRGINTEWLVTIRLLISGFILLTMAYLRKGPAVWQLWRNNGDVAQILLFGFVGIPAVQYTYFAAIEHSNAATATVLQYVGPVLIVIYLAFRNRKWPAPFQYLAVFMATIGTFLLVTHGRFDRLSISGHALFWGLGAAFGLAFYTIQPTRLLNRYDPLIITGWGMLLGGFAFSFVHAPWEGSGHWDLYTYLSTAAVILLGTVIAFSFFLQAVRLIGAETASLLSSVEPLSATVLSILWLGVSFESIDWLGGLLILSTVILLTLKKPEAAY